MSVKYAGGNTFHFVIARNEAIPVCLARLHSHIAEQPGIASPQSLLAMTNSFVKTTSADLLTTIQTRFGDLRTLSERVLAFYAHETSADKQELNSHYEIDVDGDDAEELLIKFRDQFRVDFDAFRLEDYFYGEGEWSMMAGGLLLIIAVVLLPPVWLLVQGVGIVSKSATEALREYMQAAFGFLTKVLDMREIQVRLTLGDLIVSATTGSFTTRSQTRLICHA